MLASLRPSYVVKHICLLMAPFLGDQIMHSLVPSGLAVGIVSCHCRLLLVNAIDRIQEVFLIDLDYYAGCA